MTKLDIGNQRVRRYFWNENASTIMLLIIAIFMVESQKIILKSKLLE